MVKEQARQRDKQLWRHTFSDSRSENRLHKRVIANAAKAMQEHNTAVQHHNKQAHTAHALTIFHAVQRETWFVSRESLAGQDRQTTGCSDSAVKQSLLCENVCTAMPSACKERLCRPQNGERLGIMDDKPRQKRKQSKDAMRESTAYNHKNLR